MFKLEITLGNAPFYREDVDGESLMFAPYPEIARILRDLADRIEFSDAPRHGANHVIRDYLGNTVGLATLDAQ